MNTTKVALSDLVTQAWAQVQGMVLEEVRKMIEELAEAERDRRVGIQGKAALSFCLNRPST
ncbi:MAG: hypothetical protein ACRD22_12925 [Terriglobia bacterium]